MSKFEVDVEHIKQFVKLVESYGLAELTLEEDGVSVTIKGLGSATVPPPAAQTPVAPNPAQAEIEEIVLPAAPAESEQEPEEELERITAPLVGVFYRASAPDAPPMIEIGDQIEVGQEIGLIEAMKVFSPIPSEIAGTVVAIPAENGKLVQQGQELVLIRPAKE